MDQVAYRDQNKPCKARSARGTRPCKKWAIHGGSVCDTHGGRAPQVKRKAKDRLADLIDPSRALREAASMAYSDLAEYYDDQGNIKPMSEWTPIMRASVQSLETIAQDVTPGERGPTATVHRLKLWDKPKTLEMLFKHMGLLDSKVQHQGEISIKWAEPEPRLIEAK